MADSVVSLDKKHQNKKKTYLPAKMLGKELSARVSSSVLFVPIIGIVCFAPFWAFCLLCFVAFAAITREVMFSGIGNRRILRVFALIICIIGICSFVYCRKVYGVPGCVFLICITSFTDIGAYCIGKIFKGPKLCQKISPQKTWAGFFGGILFANIAYYFIKGLFLRSSLGSELLMSTIINNFIIVQLMIFSSIAGDLLESSFKRCIGVKDVGNLFPGHGGMLDRFDSLILASIMFMMPSICY